MKRILVFLLIATMLLGLFACDSGEQPTEEPTNAPTEEPTKQSTTAPTEESTAAPTEELTTAPTEESTTAPTEEPTIAPTEESTTAPTEEPTVAPTEEPTTAPTEEPTTAPTEEPTKQSTTAPTEEPTTAPTEEPTVAPTEEPTTAPTEEPTKQSTTAPTEEPTIAPTEESTTAPTEESTAAPTEELTTAPTEESTTAPTEEPTTAPTEEPTTAPTEEPTTAPTEEPTTAPTEESTTAPTEEPTTAPTEEPTTAPTEEPTTAPTEEPTTAPTEEPTQAPTEEFTTVPTEKETDEMQTEAVYDDLASVGIYDRYDLDSYMSPIWSGKVVHNETVMFVGIDDKASLLYEADRILSVRSYDLSIEYVQGVDYDYVDGMLVLLEGTRIPYVPLETYYSVLDPNYPYLSTMYNGKVTQTMFGDGTAMTKWQVAVTYKHSDTWEGKEVESYEDRFASFIGKLERGEDVTVFFYGDSITTGATSSQSRPPYAPSYPQMFVQYVAKQYGYTVKYIDTYSNANLTNGKPAGGFARPDDVFGNNGTITYINTAVGGWSTQNGAENIREYVISYIKEYGCDLFVLAFGMNNGSATANMVMQYMRQIVNGVTRNCSEADVVLVSTMIPNPEAVRNPADKYYCNGNQYTFEEAMYPLADSFNESIKGGCAVAPMTSVSQYIHSQKRYRDTTGNNVNHPSDFLARTYAQVIYQTVFGYENYPSGPVDIGEEPVVDANYNAEITIGENKFYLDGKSVTADANFAACVRLETTENGFFMYHISNGAKEYINLSQNGELDYSDSAKSVWTYDATLKAMVCEGHEFTVALVKPEICMHPFIFDSDTHSREKCIRCAVDAQSHPHAFYEAQTKHPDGSCDYSVVCSSCRYVKSFYTVPEGMNMYYPIFSMGLFNATDAGVKSDEGFLYRSINFTSGEGHILVNGANSPSAIDEDSGRYFVIKYRAANNQSIRLDAMTSDYTSLSVITKNTSDIPSGWEVAVVDLSQFANYTCDCDVKVQIRITTGVSTFDIAYAAIVDSIDEAKKLITDDSYVLYENWAEAGEVCDTMSTPDEPEIPTEAPTAEPTEVPTAEPTEVPTAEPTEVPTSEPTEVPTAEPTEAPTAEPTEVPTAEPTEVSTEAESESASESINDAQASVGTYDEFDLDSYMTPIWDGKVVHNETVLFVGPDDTPALLYSPDRIISVRSYDLSIEYIEGIDFEIVGNKIVRLEGSRIPYMPLETYYSVLNDKPYLSTMVNGVVTQTIYGEGDTMCRWQIAITYKHSGAWEGSDLDAYTDRYAALIEKLEKGEDVTFHFYGDSITTGANSSESIGKAPYSPGWARMFTMYVAKQYGYTVKFVNSYSDESLTAGKPAGGLSYSDAVYGDNGTITYVNTAVGGWNTQQGRDNFDAYVKAYVEKYGCDLFVLAFGMNNGGSTADQVCGYLDEIVVKMEACAPDADLLLVSTMLPNPEAVRNGDDPFFNGNQSTFEEKMIPLAETINDRGTNCALAPMTSMTRHLYTIKRFRDTTGNNVNHPSDFVIRLYAQTLFQTVFGFENYEHGGIALDNKPVENANFNAEFTIDGNTLYLDGASGTDNKNYAICVRFEETAGGFHMYYVKNFAKVYINAQNGSIVYSDTATSVWAYDDGEASLVSGGVYVKLFAPEICLHPTVAGDKAHGREACVRCGIEAAERTHVMADTKTVNPDGSTTYATSCQICGKVGKSNTIPAGVIYYSGAETYKSPIFYLLNKELGEENGITFTRVTAKPGAHAHELHWIDQNNAPHNDHSGNQLDTKGARYLVIRLRASSDTISMMFKYKLLASNIGHYAVPVVKAGEWITYVLDLKTLGGTNYAPLNDGTYTMQYFKMYFDAFDHLESGYVDFEYLALCDSFDQISEIANSETVQIMTTAGNVSSLRSDGTCVGKHIVKETFKDNTYTLACEICGAVIESKTVPEDVNCFATAYTISSKANAANLINYAEVLNDEDGAYCRIYGGAAHATQNYNQFSLYGNSSASTVTGQYLVIKYRVGENGLGQKKITIYAGTENAGPTTDAERIDLYVGDGTTVEDGIWHTAIINMDTAAGIGKTNDCFKAGDDGLYRAKFVSLRPFYTGQAGGDESDYMDIAFSAICDSLEEAEKLCEDGSYDYYTTSAYPETVTVTE